MRLGSGSTLHVSIPGKPAFTLPVEPLASDADPFQARTFPPCKWEVTVELDAESSRSLDAFIESLPPAPPLTFGFESFGLTWRGIVIDADHPAYPATPPASFLRNFTVSGEGGAEMLRRFLFTDEPYGDQGQKVEIHPSTN